MAENRELALVLKLVADQFNSEMKKSGGIVGEFSKLIGDWKTQLTLAGTALFAIAKSAANFGEEALKTSQRLGLTVEKTTALQYAANQADVPVMTLERGLQTLAQRAVEAANRTGEGAKLFTSLGLSATDAAGKVKPLDQLFFEVQDRLRGLGNQAEFVDAGVQAFGKSFLDLVPFIKDGSAATREAMEEGKRLGVVLSQDQAVAASRFNYELKQLTAAQRGLTLQLGNELIPGFTQLTAAMTGLTAGPVGSLFKLEVQGWASIFTLFNHAIRETKLELDAFLNKLGKSDSVKRFWNDVLVQSRRDLDRDTEKSLHRIFSPPTSPGAVSGLASTPGGGSLLVPPKGKTEAAAIQEGLGRWIVQVEQMRQQAVAAAESSSEAEAAAVQRGLGTWIHQVEQMRQQAIAAAEASASTEAAAIQEGLGRWIVQVEQLRQRAEAERAESSRTFFDEWKLGMDRYVRDTKTGLGLGADMARRTAQAMEQSFRQFFFDVWDRKIQSMADVLETVADFAKQVLGTVFSQLATKAVLSSFGFGAAGGGEVIRRFAMGGPVLGAGNLDTVPALLTPGEYVLSRADVSEIRNGLGGGVNLTFIVNNQSNAEVGQPVVSQGPDGRRIVEMTIKNAVRGMIQSGDMDKSMNQRFGLSPTPGRR